MKEQFVENMTACFLLGLTYGICIVFFSNIMMCASIYAYKCDVSKKQLRQDLKEAYSKEMTHFPISDIEKLSDGSKKILSLGSIFFYFS